MARKVISVALVLCMLLVSVLVFGGTAVAGNGELYTAMVRDIYPGELSGLSLTNPMYSEFDGELFFFARDGTYGGELWKTDGTEAGTIIVKDINPSGSSLPSPWPPARGRFVEFNGMLFFVANDGTHGNELWKTDGTGDGTVMVKDIFPDADSAYPQELTEYNGMLFFSANDGTGYELWKTDGTGDGTAMVKDIGTTMYGAGISFLTEFNDMLLFEASDGTHGNELWKTDGTGDGTVLVKDIFPGAESGYPEELTECNGMLFFRARDNTHGFELWKTDGTGAGTAMVKDINTGIGNGLSLELELTVYNGTLFFRANDGTHGNELWKTDGAGDGTVMVKDIFPGADSACGYLLELTELNGMLFFGANDGTHSYELWKTDGTETNTVMVKDINPDTVSAPPRSLTELNGILFFSANDGTHGNELWKTDGTGDGTAMVKDINSDGPTSQGIGFGSSFAVFNGELFFGANDGIHGYELWKCVEAPDIEVAPLSIDFGDVQLGSSTTAIVTISNVGSADLVVSDLIVSPADVGYNLTTGPVLPVSILPGQTVDLVLVCAPSSLGSGQGWLEIRSNDPDESSVEVQLSSTGVLEEIPPSQQIADMLEFFDESVENGTLTGDGPGNSGEHRLFALRNMIEAAGDLINQGRIEEACQQVLDAYHRVDGLPRPPDFATGDAAIELADIILDLMADLGCQCP